MDISLNGNDLKRNSIVGGKAFGSSFAYRIRKTLASSELSIVYAARNDEEGTRCIIKEFFPKAWVRRGKDGVSVRRKAGMAEEKYGLLWNAFLNEGELLEKSRHPGVVRCLDRFEQNGTAYIVTEYLEGVTLDRYIADLSEEADPEFLYKTMIPLIEALEHIHRNGVIHRDVKPGNIMIGKDGSVKLLDFGSAISVHEQNGGYPIFTTAGYSPLELYSEKSRQGPISDIYSLSAVLYFCCQKNAPTDVRKRLFDEQLERLGTGLRRSWPFLSPIVKRGLAVSQDKRCASLRWFKAALAMEYATSPSFRRKRRSG
ncbi:serine/threonine-protein kinase [Paenibacillus sp. VCA1]|uniref:serine/threonine protein kinase n=1 Tax=Paenibacillus sp. VCA1 TaxID=3039148 RepID=UPI002871050E|nr:serine/threonine-protein kinase [Paenibacillus sp. VCA1]MDR9856606.1 serine/threonine-protein kinase [Paenibacillus sp. VCA1]